MSKIGRRRGTAYFLKTWWLLSPPEVAGAEPIIIEQWPGDLLWIPPAWFHEVLTTGGEALGSDVVAPHWVSWCLPRHLALRSLCAFLAGTVAEDQASAKPSATQKLAVYKVLTPYAEGK